MIRAQEALKYFVSLLSATDQVLNVGDKTESEANQYIAKAGPFVDTISLEDDADFVGDYASMDFPQYDAIWCCHCLEHQRNPGLFLDKIFSELKTDGLLGITVPTGIKSFVGGHVTIWDKTVLFYQLILSGFNCRDAKIMLLGKDGKHLGVIIRKRYAELGTLFFDFRDKLVIESFMPFSPQPAKKKKKKKS